ncbi:hypothetical protein D3A96_14720 [Robertkochia marina]|nr:hypothetical protein D3A96_14720 [Robertkochia marina]
MEWAERILMATTHPVSGLHPDLPRPDQGGEPVTNYNLGGKSPQNVFNYTLKKLNYVKKVGIRDHKIDSLPEAL